MCVKFLSLELVMYFIAFLGWHVLNHPHILKWKTIDSWPLKKTPQNEIQTNKNTLQFNWTDVHSVFSHQKKADSQLWISGLYPSAYWCGQAVVDISLFSGMLLTSYFTSYTSKLLNIDMTSEIVFSVVSNMVSIKFCTVTKNKMQWWLPIYLRMLDKLNNMQITSMIQYF